MHQNMHIQQPMYAHNGQFSNEIHRVMSNGLRVENRPRVSKSMDQFMVRPTSFSGYAIGNQVITRNQYQGNPIITPPQTIQPHTQHLFSPHHHQPIPPQTTRPNSNYLPPNTNLLLTPSKTLQKQV